jgi:hypothetical protein
MSDGDNSKTRKTLEEALRELGDVVHVPPEVILAYADGRLASPARESIGKHLDKCDECQQVLRLARESMVSEKTTTGRQNDATGLAPEPIASKALLIAHIYGKRDDVVQEVARLLLPKELWFSIRPTVKTLRNWRKTTSHDDRGHDISELPAAAFAGGGGPEDKQAFETVLKVVDLVDGVCVRLSERCRCKADVATQLPGCVEDAVSQADRAQFVEADETEILNVLLGRLATDAE